MTGRATAALAVRPRGSRAVALHGAAAVVVACAGAVAGVLSGGCFGREKPDINSEDAALKIPAIKSAARVRRKDVRVATRLVKDLDSDDPAVRFYSIEALQRMTGETFGYRYFDDEIERKPALKQWQAWLARVRGEKPATTPATAPSSRPASGD